MIGYLQTRVISLYFESENELKFYNLEASFLIDILCTKFAEGDIVVWSFILTLSLPSTSKNQYLSAKHVQGLLNIEVLWVQHRVSPESPNLPL